MLFQLHCSRYTEVFIGALFLSTLGPARADRWPGWTRFDDICREIIDDVVGNSIPFRELVNNYGNCWWWTCESYLQVHETLSRSILCDRLTQLHNSVNSAYLGGASVYSYECQNALNAPALYGLSDWNNWSGRHCGTWRNTDGTGVFLDNAIWYAANPSSGYGYNRQSVTFLTRNCCNNGWNESGGTVSIFLSQAVKLLLLCCHL